MADFITNTEYDQIQEDCESLIIWTQFRKWLMEDQGVAKATARTYATQARRILRELNGYITPKSLFDWVNCRPAGHRTPFRSSWRRYCLFMQNEQNTLLATFPQGENVPDEIIAALLAIKNRKIGSGSISRLTINCDTGVRFKALAEINRDIERGSVVLALDDNNSLYLIPTSAHTVLLEWGRQGSRMDDTANPRWLVPAIPGAKDSMKPIKITRLVRGASK